MVRQHAEIVRKTGAIAVHSRLQAKGFPGLTIGSVHAWGARDSIPGEYWKALAEGGFSTLEELATYAESKKAVAGAIKDGLAEGAMSEIMTAAAGICAEGALATRRDADRDRPESVLA